MPRDESDEPAILIMYSTAPPTTGHLQRLVEIGGHRDVVVADSEHRAMQTASRAEIILGHRYLWQVLPTAQRLAWVQSSAAGIDHLLVPDLFIRSPILTRCPIFGEVIAWHALAMALTLSRGLPGVGRTDEPVREVQPTELPRTAMIFGMGEIGQQLGRILVGMGVRVIGVNRSGIAGAGSFDTILKGEDSWEEFVHQVDLFFICCPATTENHKIIGANVLDHLPDSAILVNVGRGRVIDYEATIPHLKDGRISAGLDVLDGATDAEIKCLQSLPNVIYSRKTASFHPSRQERFERFVESQVQRFVVQQPLLHRVH